MTVPDRDSGRKQESPGSPLGPSQDLVLATLAEREAEEFGRADYRSIAHVSRSQAGHEVSGLLALGLIERLGRWPARRYRLTRPAGRPPESGRREAIARGESLAAADPVLVGLAALFVLAFATLFVLIQHARPVEDLRPAAAVLEGHDAAFRPVAVSTPRARPGVTLRLTAARGDSSLAVRRGSARGKLLWKGVLARGESLRFRGGRLWIDVGAPAHLAARLNGEPVAFPADARALRVSAAGVRVLAAVAAPPLLVEATAPAPASAPPSHQAASPSSPAASASPARPAPDAAPSGSRPSPDPWPPGG